MGGFAPSTPNSLKIIAIDPGFGPVIGDKLQISPTLPLSPQGGRVR